MSLREMKEEFRQTEGDPADQGQNPAVAQRAHAQAHDGGGAEGLGRHHQPDPLRRRAAIRARHERAGLRRQGRRPDRPQDPRGRGSPRHSGGREPAAWPARCMPRSRSTRKFRRNIIARSPKSSATSCGCAGCAGAADAGSLAGRAGLCSVFRKVPCAIRRRKALRARHDQQAQDRAGTIDWREIERAMTAQHAAPKADRRRPDPAQPGCRRRRVRAVDRSAGAGARRQRRSGAAGGRACWSPPRPAIVLVGGSNAEPYILGVPGGARHGRRVLAVRARLRHHAALRPRAGQSADQGGGRRRLRRHRRHRQRRPRHLCQCRLSRSHRRGRCQRHAAGRARLHRRCRRLRGDLPAAQGGARRQAPAGRGARRRR